MANFFIESKYVLVFIILEILFYIKLCWTALNLAKFKIKVRIIL